MTHRLSVVALAVVFLPVVAAGQSPRANGAGGPAADLPAPVPPEVITRAEDGRVVVRAIRLTEPLRVDGRLDEAVYQNERPIGDFIQAVPASGQPATERTEAWIMFDKEYIYVSGRCYDSEPPEKWTANELRRDTNQLRQN